MSESAAHADVAVHPADALLEAVERCRAPVCVGIDPVYERLPASLHRGGGATSSCVREIQEFSEAVIEAVAPAVPCVKLQSACFERYGSAGVDAIDHLCRRARALGLHVILDAKRGDIGISAEHYAAGIFERPGPDHAPQWITINSYLGEDSIRPFLRESCGAFALVRTSNPGSDAIQTQRLRAGETVAEAVAKVIAAIGRDHVGTRGYSRLGAVVGATKSSEAASLRAIMPQQIFLVPGYGAQGGGVEDVLPCFDAGGRGAIVTASRSVIYAFKSGETNWTNAVADAAARFAEAIGAAVGLR